MASVANPAKPRTHNALMTADGWGTIYCRVMAIGHGISVVSTGTKSRVGRVLYVTRRTSGSFGATFLCASDKEYEDFGNWIQGYGRRLAVSAPSVGPVRLVCPSRNFDKVAIPSGVSFGAEVGLVTHTVSINFLGSRDPVPLTSDFTSIFTMPSGSGDQSLPYYYPGGTQLTGGQFGVDSAFDVPPSLPSALQPGGPPVRPPSAGGSGSQRPV